MYLECLSCVTHFLRNFLPLPAFSVFLDVVLLVLYQVDGFSSDTSFEFEDLMSSNNLDEMQAEV